MAMMYWQIFSFPPLLLSPAPSLLPHFGQSQGPEGLWFIDFHLGCIFPGFFQVFFTWGISPAWSFPSSPRFAGISWDRNAGKNN